MPWISESSDCNFLISNSSFRPHSNFYIVIKMLLKDNMQRLIIIILFKLCLGGVVNILPVLFAKAKPSVSEVSAKYFLGKNLKCKLDMNTLS